VRWEVEVELSVPDLRDERRREYEQVVERVAGRVAVAGCEGVRWSGDSLDAGLGFNWFTTHALAFVLTSSAEAPAYRPVRARVREAVLDEVEAGACRAPYERGAEDIQDRWGVEVRVRPPGYEWRPPAL
jgi:hypothetical protein